MHTVLLAWSVSFCILWDFLEYELSYKHDLVSFLIHYKKSSICLILACPLCYHSIRRIIHLFVQLYGSTPSTPTTSPVKQNHPPLLNTKGLKLSPPNRVPLLPDNQEKLPQPALVSSLITFRVPRQARVICTQSKTSGHVKGPFQNFRCVTFALLTMTGGPRVVVSTAAIQARVRGSVPGLGGLKETKNVSSPSTCESQYCGEPPWPRGSVLGLRPPGLEFRILCLEDSVISIISPSSGGSPGPV